MRSFFTTVLAIFPAILFAQSNYHAGYVLKNNGDTLKGFIDYREWANSPTSIDFKVTEANLEVLKFDPRSIKSFEITGLEKYISYSGMISMNSIDLQNLPTRLDTSVAKENIFLRELEAGKNITLYMQSDNVKTRFFIAEKNRLPIELRYYAYFFDGSRSTEKDDYIFRGQFILYVHKYNQGNEKLLDEAAHLRFEQSDIEKIVAEINGDGVFDHRVKISGTNPKPGTRFFAGIGANFENSTYNYFDEVITTTQLPNNVTQVNETFVPKSVSSQVLLPKISVGGDVFLNPNVQKVVFRLEWSLFFASHSFAYSGSDPSSTDKAVFSFSQLTSTFTPQIIINIYNKDNFKVYIDAGYALNFAANSGNPIVTNSRTGATISTVYMDDKWASTPIQIGVVLNRKIEISLNYDSYTNGLSNKSACLGVKYFFVR
jgi:hypothetical protein